ncbi:hypothetical protein HMPREF1624_07897 [Sporothrix schenckii ATCC 58251]|uniref:Alpha/beta hydrolase fold-3 domain-containing protein n=1 Tax=Sporothrix schenckii (strain ATCC 58251 / de Perez 2211183) TaxID=1391915 RepID=U7PMS6_SPOS1|nr:hypothetical protein HMPREF1624_07897 [Sporothrix schenckii ATCC 58251]
MIDHVLGRPSIKSRRLQVLAVLAFWSTYLARGDKNGPPGARSLSRLLSKRLTAWQVVVLTMLYLYASRNFSTLVGLASPDPLTNMYDATFFRATWVLTALDAGFWTAMKIRTKWLRDLASIVFSGFYLVAAEKADEKVRKVRGNLTVEHLRVSWNKGTTPYLRFFQGLLHPRLTRWPARLVRIPRPATSDYQDQPIMAWLYYDGSIDHLRASGLNRVILDFPGGGFVAMDPRCNDDRLFSWAVQTGLPVLSLDYKKAPEYPFPYALNECYDAYATLVHSRGRCIGLAAHDPVRVVVTGDSAGGNLATAMTLMLAQQSAPGTSSGGHRSTRRLPLPDGLVLTYPCMDVNIGNWMSDEQMALIRDRRTRATNRNVLRRKTKQYSDLAGTPHESDDEDLTMTKAVPSSDDASQGKDRNSNGNVDFDNDDDDDDDDDDELVRSKARRPKPAYSHVNVSSYSRPQTPTNEWKRELGLTTGTATDSIESETVRGASASPLGSGGSDSKAPTASYHPQAISTQLATASTISYFNDRVLTPEMMRAMIILYIGPHNRPDFSQDYLLSPILAPDLLLAHFPKTYFLTGERDPLVDDTVIFAGRLRRVKAAYYASGGRRVEYRESDARTEGFDDRDVAEVVLIPGVSHGFLQFPAVYPPAWKWFQRASGWIQDAFQHADEVRARSDAASAGGRMPRGRTTSRTNTSEQNEAAPTLATPPATKAALSVDTKTATATTQPPDTDGTGTTPYTAGHSRVVSSARTESSGDEAPLEMIRMTKVGKTNASTEPAPAQATMTAPAAPSSGSTTAPTSTSTSTTMSSAATTPDNNSTAGAGKPKSKKQKALGRQRAKDSKGDKELVKLKSSDDLLGRRMQGIVGGLTGVSEE